MTDTRAPGPIASEGKARIESLDFVRGIAVMGILAANIISFGQPQPAYTYPGAFTVPHTRAEDWMWVAQFALIDGKMRGLFTLLFGAGMVLFVERSLARGATRMLQVRRLLWLALFGALHYFLLWRGDILFVYACAGLAALPLMNLDRHKLLILGLLGFVGGALISLGFSASMADVADSDFGARAATAAAAELLETEKQAALADGVLETGMIQEGRYGEWVVHNVEAHGVSLLWAGLSAWIETLPLMLIGMALFRYGLFSGGIDARKQAIVGSALLCGGAILSLLVALDVASGGFSYYATLAAFNGWGYVPALLSTLGLAALLSLLGARAEGWLASRIRAAGRAAFSNYLGTSVAMVLFFHGWAGGLFGQLGRAELYAIVPLAWLAMLAWSQPWLLHYHHGPLEWLWRCLTYGRRFAFRKAKD